MDGLIGDTGFVGTTLRRQRGFDRGFASRTIPQIDGADFDTLVCAGAPAAKWIANADPAADARTIEMLAGHLDHVQARRFVLISTIDVFDDPDGIDESAPTDAAGLTAYGRNRLWLERFVRGRFPDALIVRLPGLVGPGLRKNAVFDLLNANQVDRIDGRASFQFYPMVNLWCDIQIALAAGLDLVHLTAAPLTIEEIAAEAFGLTHPHRRDDVAPARYDLRTRHAGLFGGGGLYCYDRRASLLAIRAYAQSEPRRVKP